MRFFIEFLCSSIFKELVAWKEVNAFILELRGLNKFTADELWVMRQAAYFSAFIHRKETRADGSKYITHPLEVAKIVVFELRVFDLETILSAIFHDNAENSGWPWGLIFIIIEKLSTSKVPVFVFFLSKHFIRSVFRAYFYVMITLRELRVILPKVADRIHNLRTLSHMSFSGQDRKLNETRKYFPSLIAIIMEDIQREENKELAQNVENVEQLGIRCQKIFDDALASASDELKRTWICFD